MPYGVSKNHLIQQVQIYLLRLSELRGNQPTKTIDKKGILDVYMEGTIYDDSSTMGGSRLHAATTSRLRGVLVEKLFRPTLLQTLDGIPAVPELGHIVVCANPVVSRTKERLGTFR
jgi:hypothetical protein